MFDKSTHFKVWHLEMHKFTWNLFECIFGAPQIVSLHSSKKHTIRKQFIHTKLIFQLLTTKHFVLTKYSKTKSKYMRKQCHWQNQKLRTVTALHIWLAVKTNNSTTPNQAAFFYPTKPCLHYIKGAGIIFLSAFDQSEMKYINCN